MPADDTPNTEKVGGVDVLIGAMYAIAIGINVYLVADQLSNGALSRSLSMRLVTLRGRADAWLERQRIYRREAPHVVWEAMETVEGNEA